MAKSNSGPVWMTYRPMISDAYAARISHELCDPLALLYGYPVRRKKHGMSKCICLEYRDRDDIEYS